MIPNINRIKEFMTRSRSWCTTNSQAYYTLYVLLLLAPAIINWCSKSSSWSFCTNVSITANYIKNLCLFTCNKVYNLYTNLPMAFLSVWSILNMLKRKWFHFKHLSTQQIVHSHFRDRNSQLPVCPIISCGFHHCSSLTINCLWRWLSEL